MSENRKIKQILRGLKACHDQKKQLFIKDKEADRLKLFQQYSAHHDLPVPGVGSEAHNQIIGHLDQHHPMWRGYDPYTPIKR